MASKTCRIMQKQGETSWTMQWYERGHRGKVQSKSKRAATKESLIQYARKKKFTCFYDGLYATQPTQL